MNINQRKQIGRIWLAVAEMNGKEITQTALSLMLDSISDLDAEKVLLALQNWAKVSKHARHPIPSEIRALVTPSFDNDSEAREAGSRVVAAVSKFGYSNPEKAQEYIGELGWRVVNRWGGWSYICQNLGVSIDITTFQAQARDLAKALLQRAAYGADDLPPALNHNASNPLLGVLKGNDMNEVIKINRGENGSQT